MKITNLPIPLIDRVRAQNPVVLTVPPARWPMP